MDVIHVIVTPVNVDSPYVYHYVTTQKADMQAQLGLLAQLLDQPYGLKVITTNSLDFGSVQQLVPSLRNKESMTDLIEFKDSLLPTNAE